MAPIETQLRELYSLSDGKNVSLLELSLLLFASRKDRVSVREMAKMTGWHETTVSTASKKLVDLELIDRVYPAEGGYRRLVLMERGERFLELVKEMLQ